MWVALLSFAVSALADDLDNWTAPVTRDPVLEWAARDLRASRRTRVAIAVSITAPGLFFVGELAARSFADTSDSGYVAGVGLAAVGAVGATAAPLVLFVDVGRSRAALRAQGLGIGRTRTWISLPLWAASVGTIGYLVVAHTGELDMHRAGVVFGVSAYAGSLVFAMADVAANNTARREAGWVIVPLLRDGARGIAVAARI
jgi:hypothetical protein